MRTEINQRVLCWCVQYQHSRGPQRQRQRATRKRNTQNKCASVCHLNGHGSRQRSHVHLSLLSLDSQHSTNSERSTALLSPQSLDSQHLKLDTSQESHSHRSSCHCSRRELDHTVQTKRGTSHQPYCHRSTCRWSQRTRDRLALDQHLENPRLMISRLVPYRNTRHWSSTLVPRSAGL